VDRATICLKHGDRTGALQHLLQYEALCDCGVSRPDLESRVRGLFVQLGQLPEGHRVPSTVGTLAELLAVFSVNQDSPERTFSLGGGWMYEDAPAGSKTGAAKLNWRILAVVNCNRYKPYLRTQRSPGDITGSLVTWDGGEFGRAPGDRHGQPVTRRHFKAAATLAIRLWATVLAFEARASVYGWSLCDSDREGWGKMLSRTCERGGIAESPLPEVNPIIFEPTGRPAPRRNRRRSAAAVPK
jgi:hypothetical protein